MEIIDLGTRRYREVWDLQKEKFHALIDAKRSGTIADEYLLLVEHYPVYTLGLHGKTSNMLLNERDLANRGIEFLSIERGGDITFHGLGQLVVYPIIDLQAHSLGVKKYVDLLEESVIRLLKHFNIEGNRVEGATGVWIDIGSQRERKICAIGVKCSHFVTMHGLALNVNTDLSYFSAINPCGFVDKGVTSINKEIGHDVSMDYVKALFTDIFIKLLNE